MISANKRRFGPEPRYPAVQAYRQNAPEKVYVLAGPCAIESVDQVLACTQALSRIQPAITYMRGGVFRAGTYPPKEFGLQKELLRDWSFLARAKGLSINVEVFDPRDIDYIDKYADAFQVGARQGQGYVILSELAKQTKPVFLKRGMGMKLDEFLGAAEYLVRGKPSEVILIERGGASHLDHVRWDLSISLIAAVKAETKLPIIVDPSHGTGRRDLVEPMLYAGMAAGADGFLVEVHPDPDKSLSDAEQATPIDNLQGIVDRAMAIRKARG